MPLQEDVVGVATLLRIHGVEPEVVDEQEIDAEEFPQFGLVALGQAGMLEGFEHPVGADGQHRVPTAAGDVAEGMGRERLADPDRPADGDVVMAAKERRVTNSLRSARSNVTLAVASQCSS